MCTIIYILRFYVSNGFWHFIGCFVITYFLIMIMVNTIAIPFKTIILYKRDEKFFNRF